MNADIPEVGETINGIEVGEDTERVKREREREVCLTCVIKG